jgi:hypothetical protein
VFEGLEEPACLALACAEQAGLKSFVLEELHIKGVLIPVSSLPAEGRFPVYSFLIS